MADRERMTLIAMVVVALLAPGLGMAAFAAAGSGLGSGTINGTVAAVDTFAGTEVFTQLFREGLLKHKESDYTAAAALFGQAEQVAVIIGEKAQAAYFQGNAFFEAREYKLAEQSFRRVVAYGQAQVRVQAQAQAQAQESAQGCNTVPAKYVSLAEIALQECAACINPLVDFPTGMYLWIRSNMGTATLASVDRYLNVWDNTKIYLYVIVLLILLWRGLIKIRRRKTKKA